MILPVGLGFGLKLSDRTQLSCISWVKNVSVLDTKNSTFVWKQEHLSAKYTVCYIFDCVFSPLFLSYKADIQLGWFYVHKLKGRLLPR